MYPKLALGSVFTKLKHVSGLGLFYFDPMRENWLTRNKSCVTSSVSGVFDVVIIVGALDAGFVPVAAVRELCHAAKPGNELAAVSMGPNIHTGQV